MITKNWRLPRRTFLKGLGTVMALPLLEAMTPAATLANAAVGGAKTTPKRLAFIYVPNGANMADWTPSLLGSDFELPAILKPLQPIKDDLLVISGLAADKARPNGDGAG